MTHVVRALALFLLLVTLGAGRGFASPADSHLREGQRQLLAGHFAEAIRQLDVAARLTYARPQLARIQLLRAQCFAATGDARGVDDALRQALQADPEASLDPTKIVPTLVQRLEALRSRLRGTLDLDVEPADAAVKLDGRPLEGNQFRGELPVGHHLIEAAGNGAAGLRREVVIRPDEVQTVQLTLIAAPVSLAPVAPPAPAVQPPPPSAVSTRRRGPLDAPNLALGASVRGYAALAGGPAGAGVEGDVGLQGKLWRAEVGALGGRSPGLTLRAGVDARDVLGPVGFFADAEGVLLLSPSNGGVGGEVGVSVHPVSVLELFLSANYVHLLGRGSDLPNNVLLGGGVRAWLPVK